MGHFKIMHENIALAIFKYEDGELLDLVINEKHTNKLPYLDASNNTIEFKLKKWIRNRSIPITRQGIKSELKSLNKNDLLEYMMDNLGLSLTDHYWICPVDSTYTWQEINAYTNDFKSTYSLDLKDDIKTIAGRTNFVPSSSLKGDLKKKWIIGQNGTRRLVKGNYNHSSRQSLCEVLATEIHKRQNKFEYTPYSLIEISSNDDIVMGCECPNFTNINTEFISAIEILDSFKVPNNLSYYESYIQYCGSHGINIDYIRAFMEYQILTDFIISNSDRHLNNFGVIRDSNTFNLLYPAPIFDSGNSMFYKDNIKVSTKGLLNISVTSFKKKEIQLLEYVTNPLLIDLSLLPSADEVVNLFIQDKACTEEDAIKLGRAYQGKIELIDKFQHGTKIYSYDFMKKYK